MTPGRRAARRPPLVIVAIFAVLVIATSLGAAPTVTLARLTDAAAASGTLATGTLRPPTALVATGGSSVGLSWVATPDVYATGYGIYRGPTNAASPTLVSTVTPGTATAATDAPGAGTWWYVLRAQYRAWTSVPTSQVSATVGTSTTTTAAPCTTTTADVTGAGDGDGYETSPSRACVDDSSFAVDGASGTGGSQSCGTGAVPDAAKDRHRFWGFATGVPGAVTSIDGIEVRADLALNNNGGTTSLCAQVSWDAGATWSTIQSADVVSRTETSYLFGSATDTWGHGWTVSQLDPTRLRVRLIDASTMSNKDFQLDYVAVTVTYRP